MEKNMKRFINNHVHSDNNKTFNVSVYSKITWKV